MVLLKTHTHKNGPNAFFKLRFFYLASYVGMEDPSRVELLLINTLLKMIIYAKVCILFLNQNDTKKF